MVCEGLVSINDLSRDDMVSLLQLAKERKEGERSTPLVGKILGSCFFEPSTRTRLSFEAAMIRLGGQCIGFTDPAQSSLAKGESLTDTIRVMGSYADVLVVRHPEVGAVSAAQKATSTPVINGGDGSGEHPTQTLTDLFTLFEAFGSLENKKIALCGDLLHSRTIHSLVQALTLFGAHLLFVAESGCEMPRAFIEKLDAPYSEHSSLERVIEEADALYMTRLQKERHTTEKETGKLMLTKSLLQKGKPSLKVLHPLPRLHEIDPSVDATQQALYFTQAKNGVFVREALILKILEQKESLCLKS